MKTLSSRSLLFCCAIGLIAASPFALAQVTINLASSPPPQQTDCTVTTDANGLSLAGNSTVLQATGVTYSGPGCGGTSVFKAQLSVPSGTAAGTPVNVTWSAAAAATQCVYAGSAPPGGSLAGWPFGATACTGSACGTSHTTSVNPTIGGSYNLAILCTNGSGIAQGQLSASAPPQPPQPANFALTSDAAPVAGTPFNVSWAVSGANTCTGSATLANSSVSLPGWTDSTTAISPRTVTAAQSGTYTLGLSCQNAAGTTSSQPLSVTVSAPAGACNGPAGLSRQTTGTVSYTMSGSATRDFTSWTDIWGHMTSSDTAVAWPGAQGSPAIPFLNRNSFIAAQFTVPVGVPLTISGVIARTTYNYGIDMTAAISQTCGDFSPPNIAACTSNTPAGPFPRWQTNPAGNQCPLPPGTYYLNIKATNPNQVTPTCAANKPTCPMGTQLNFNQ